MAGYKMAKSILFHNMKKNLSLLIILCISMTVFGQGPYKLKPAIDVPLTVGGAALCIPGLKYLRDKPYLDSAYAVQLKPEDVNRFDRGATRYTNNSKHSGFSDIALYSSFLLPVLLLADKEVRADAPKVGFLYLQTMAIMANAYLWGVGSTERIRPYVYNPDTPIENKLGRGTTNSFFAGHPAAAAASTFFFAKVYSDYHPDSKLKNVFWGAAIIPPAVVAYFRYKDGQHFPTDIIAGIPLGFAIGVLVPHLHKTKTGSDKVQIYPSREGVGICYRF